nr:Rne/Rng family ribonuclease [Pseudomonadota bacterium]
IQDVLKPGQELVVQVVKDQRALKGATLTTNLSIPGRFLVLMIGNQRGGVSRKIVDEGQRDKLRDAIDNLKLPPGMGVIVRTAGINKSSAELQRDLDSLLEQWFEILQKSSEPGSPKILYQEADLSVRTIRDYLTSDIDQIIIDEQKTYEKVCNFISKTIPAAVSKVHLFDQPVPLFSYYHLDAQVDATTKSEVTLPSGGSIVINITEAIVSVDVNSGRSTKQADVEETAFNTNKEAAEVIAQQLRLRDLGGLVVIDFIDMSNKRHKQIVEKVLRDSIRIDKAKIELGRISKFGLLEMSRQRLKTSLTSQSHVLCPHCAGQGRVRTQESASLEVLRKIQSAAFAGGVSEIRVRMAPSAALTILNNKRQLLTEFEKMSGTTILIFADGRLKPEEYELELNTGKTDDHPTTNSELDTLKNLKKITEDNTHRRQMISENPIPEEESEEDRPNDENVGNYHGDEDHRRSNNRRSQNRRGRPNNQRRGPSRGGRFNERDDRNNRNGGGQRFNSRRNNHNDNRDKPAQDSPNSERFDDKQERYEDEDF